jgi:hypothetical protein
MIKRYNQFLNEASNETEIKTLEVDISKLRDQIATAKDAVKNAANDAARRTAQINAYNVESTVLTQIAAKLKELARLMALPTTTT